MFSESQGEGTSSILVFSELQTQGNAFVFTGRALANYWHDEQDRSNESVLHVTSFCLAKLCQPISHCVFFTLYVTQRAATFKT